MQEWGIYWWFEHSEDSHTLVLADAISAHKACPDSPLVEWHREGLKLDKEFIHTITASERLRTGQWVLDDFDFKNHARGWQTQWQTRVKPVMPPTSIMSGRETTSTRVKARC